MMKTPLYAVVSNECSPIRPRPFDAEEELSSALTPTPRTSPVLFYDAMHHKMVNDMQEKHFPPKLSPKLPELPDSIKQYFLEAGYSEEEIQRISFLNIRPDVDSSDCFVDFKIKGL